MEAHKNLTKAEEQVMQVLWEIEKGTTHQLLEHFEAPKPHYNTVSTILKILVDKGFVTVEQIGKTNIYIPTCEKEQYSKNAVRQLVSNYFGGSFSKMLSAFASEKDISMKEMEKVMKAIEKNKSKK